VGYAEYLELPKLLALQRPLAQPPVHDEMLFVIVHQTHELWFKQILLELYAVIDHLDGGRWQLACRTLDRVSAIVALLMQHMEVLGTMPQGEFERFRPVLGTASGMQSAQFKHIEELSGDPGKAMTSGPNAVVRTDPGSTVRQAFLRAVGCGDGGDVPRHLQELLRDPERSLQKAVAEKLMVFDEQLARWRRSHVVLVQKMIGSAAGTGGSTGVQYLKGTLSKRFFPELWSASESEREAPGDDDGLAVRAS
jgi:tryptophan 2,3-dioxygenase